MITLALFGVALWLLLCVAWWLGGREKPGRKEKRKRGGLDVSPGTWVYADEPGEFERLEAWRAAGIGPYQWESEDERRRFWAMVNEEPDEWVTDALAWHLHIPEDDDE